MKQLIIFLFSFNFIFGQSDVPLTLRAQFNGSYGYTIIGNTLNQLDNWQNPPPNCQIETSSSASLSLLTNQSIVAAYLYWGGIGDGTFDPEIKLNGISYMPSETFVCFPENNTFINYFNSFVDVTTQVLATGNNIYTFSDLDLNPIIIDYCSNAIYNGGWHILIIYNQILLPNNQINIYDGNNVVSNYFNNGITQININNLNVLDTNNAKLTYVALNGSPNLFFNESISFNGNILSNSLNPPDNPFNGTNNFTGSTTNWNQDIDTFDISSFISTGDTGGILTLNSVFFRVLQTLVTSIRSELPDAKVQINQVSGQGVCGNRNLLVDYTVYNTNSNAVLPANANVSLYADNTFLQTVVTPTPIAVGGSLNLQTTVNIPLSIPDNFTLKIIVDNNNVNLSQIAESNEANNEDDLAISLTPTTLIAPTFTQVNPICASQTLNALPTISNNGISGNWSPSLNNQATTTYTFTPNIGQCATTATMTVVVNQNVVPTFTQVNPICAGQTLNALPTLSNNGISGSWSPSLNNQSTTTYIFTPNAGQCATTATMTIVVNQNSIPTFTQVNPICAGQTLNALPTLSNNGISGSWSPSLNNLAMTTYTFTPNTGQCATTATMTIVVNQNSVSDFADVTICSDQTDFVLNSQSPNGILGSWSPSTIDFTNSGTYTFTPNNQCSNSQTITITITQNVLFDFDYTISNSLLDTATIAITTNSSGNILYQLDNDAPQSNPFFENVSSGSHTIIVYDQNVCENSISKNIFIVSYPKFFTPNNDGFNDVWTIQESDYFKIKSLAIFDRYGKLIKELNKTSTEWNGTYNGLNIRADDYWFSLSYIENGIERAFKSHFTLKR